MRPEEYGEWPDLPVMGPMNADDLDREEERLMGLSALVASSVLEATEPVRKETALEPDGLDQEAMRAPEMPPELPQVMHVTQAVPLGRLRLTLHLVAPYEYRVDHAELDDLS